MILPQETIRKKRDGTPLGQEEISAFIKGIVAGDIGEAQIAAFAMATLLKGMSNKECVFLTLAMRDSGETLSWSSLPGPVVDKHSTGGVGDLVSLVLGPLVAACGGFVPMISGRGLGHTGGTLDKLEAIPGYNTTPDTELFERTVKECGVAIIGQTALLAPADRRIYAVRDVTATVESLDLITASILSKKLAAGLKYLVMDVKFGNGAFMVSPDDARALARRLIDVANGAGLPTRALITAMDQPLARAAGNALEVHEAVKFLKGGAVDPRLREVTLALSAQMLLSAGLAESPSQASTKLEAALTTGRAAEIFEKMVHNLGGPSDFMARTEEYLPSARFSMDVLSPIDGHVAEMQTRDLGMAVVALGGGRARTTDVIDHSVGLVFHVSLGDRVMTSQPLATIHARHEHESLAIKSRILDAIRISDSPATVSPTVLDSMI